MAPRMSRYGAYVPGLASCWPVLDRLVQCWVALASAVIVGGRLVRRAWTHYRWTAVPATHSAYWRSLLAAGPLRSAGGARWPLQASIR
jgi:hypothetical protein